MSLGSVISLMRSGIFQVLLLSAPILIVALVVGLIVAIVQAATSIQEQTLTFVPKIMAILLTLALLSGWMFTTLRDYTVGLFQLIPTLVR